MINKKSTREQNNTVLDEICHIIADKAYQQSIFLLNNNLLKTSGVYSYDVTQQQKQKYHISKYSIQIIRENKFKHPSTKAQSFLYGILNSIRLYDMKITIETPLKDDNSSLQVYDQAFKQSWHQIEHVLQMQFKRNNNIKTNEQEQKNYNNAISMTAQQVIYYKNWLIHFKDYLMHRDEIDSQAVAIYKLLIQKRQHGVQITNLEIANLARKDAMRIATQGLEIFKNNMQTHINQNGQDNIAKNALSMVGEWQRNISNIQMAAGWYAFAVITRLNELKRNNFKLSRNWYNRIKIAKIKA